MEKTNKSETTCCRNPFCIYFPNSLFENSPWETDENGVKHHLTPFEPKCGYDNHLITSWDTECPRSQKTSEGSV